MTLYAILWRAIAYKQCLRLLVLGGVREICPYALGFKSGRIRLLAYQFAGASRSGLAPGGQWRTFFLTEIENAVPIEGAWRIGPMSVAKFETCLDRIQCRATA